MGGGRDGQRAAGRRVGGAVHFLFLAALMWLPTVAARQAQTLDINGHSIAIEADHIQVDGAARKAYLVGGAAIRSGRTSFRADQIVVDYSRPERPSATAAGHVVLDSPQLGRVTGDRLRYDLAVQRGEIHDVEVTIPLDFTPNLSDLMRSSELPKELRLRATEAAQLGNQVLLKGTSATCSSSRPPQFLLKSDQIVVSAGKLGVLSGLEQLQARGVKLQLYGLTVLGLPDMNLRSGDIIIPRVGLDSTYGLYVERSLVPIAAKPFRLTITPRVGTNLLMTGHGEATFSTDVGRLALSAAYRNRLVLPVSRQTVVYSVGPELSWRTAEFKLPRGGGSWSGGASGGYYREIGGPRAWRAQTDLTYRQPLYANRTTRAWIAGTGWYAVYGRAGHYGWLRGDLGLEKRFGDLAYVGVGATSHWIGGQTPVRFDRIELVSDVTVSTRWRVARQWLIGNRLDYDLERGAVRREEYSLAYRDRLIEYELRVLTQPSTEVRLGARLLGF